MHFRGFKLSLIFLCIKIHFIIGSIDINLSEFQYIADHLSERECIELVTSLHFHSFELPKNIKAAERRIPADIPCLDLLLHWNSAFKEGRGETHTEVCHRLNQIGRKDLAEWLSKTVFHEISKDLKAALTTSTKVISRPRSANISERCVKEKFIDEAAWWKIDSLLEILIVFGLICIFIESLLLCVLCFSRAKKEISR